MSLVALLETRVKHERVGVLPLSHSNSLSLPVTQHSTRVFYLSLHRHCSPSHSGCPRNCAIHFWTHSIVKSEKQSLKRRSEVLYWRDIEAVEKKHVTKKCVKQTKATRSLAVSVGIFGTTCNAVSLFASLGSLVRCLVNKSDPKSTSLAPSLPLILLTHQRSFAVSPSNLPKQLHRLCSACETGYRWAIHPLNRTRFLKYRWQKLEIGNLREILNWCLNNELRNWHEANRNWETRKEVGQANWNIALYE